MSEKTQALRATLKAGTEFSSPWLTVDADNPAELEQKLRDIIDSKVLETVAEAASMFQATQNAAPLTQPQGALAQGSSFGGGDRGLNAPAAPQQQNQGWGAAQQQSAPPQNNSGGGGYGNVQLHPEGTQCGVCGEVLQYGKTRTNKGQWKCPQYRWNNGNPNNHTLEWA